MKLRYLILSLLIPAQAIASVAFTFDFASLRDSTGNALNNSSSFILVADSNDDGLFPDASTLLGEILATTLEFGGTGTNGDRIFYADSLSSTGSASGFVSVDYSATSPGVAVVPGDLWGIFWFPNLAVGGTIAAGQTYGFFQSSVIDESLNFGSNWAMTFPTDSGQAVDVFYWEEEKLVAESFAPTANTPSVSDFSANYNVIPEPSSAALGLMGLAGACMVRRRRD